MPSPAQGLGPALLGLALLACARGSAPPPPDLPLVEAAPPEAVRALLEGSGAETAPGPLTIEIEHPAEGAILVDEPGAEVAGRIRAAGSTRRLDVMVVIDRSGSTATPSGADVDGDGKVAFDMPGRSAHPGDSILAAEIASARSLIATLDPRRTRIGIVSFSGYQPGNRNTNPGSHRSRWRQSTQVEVPLVRDPQILDSALEAVLARGPEGTTDISGALDRAVRELTGASGAASVPDPEAERLVVFLTDGTPTLPDWADPERNEREVLRAADRASRAGVRVHSFAIGPEALERPLSAVEMARRTGGVFTPVRDPAHLDAAVRAVGSTLLEVFTLENLSTARGPERLEVGADGSWRGLVALVPGPNRLEARVTREGVETVLRRTVHYAPGHAEAFVPPSHEQHLRLVEEGRGLGLLPDPTQRRVIEILARDRELVQREAAQQLEALEAGREAE